MSQTIAFTADEGGIALGGRYHAPHGAAKAAVLICGAMGVKQDYYAEFAQWLAAQGYAALSFDYRGMGDSGGEPRRLDSVEADICAAAAALRKAVANVQDIVLLGGGCSNALAASC